VADVTDPASIAAAADTVRSMLDGATLFGLVNNAGIALGGPLLHQPMAEIRQTLEVNLFGVLECVRAFAPLLGAEAGRTGAPGRIVTIGSISGRMAVPFMGAYSASKHAVKAISEALRRELVVYGIDVLLLEPGSVVTPIWDKALTQETTAYDATPFAAPLRAFMAMAQKLGAAGLPARAIGEAVWESLTARTPPTRRVLVRGRLLNFTIPSLLPERLVDRLLGAQLGLRR
jgi:NAD(P)-dependent dehydrogenase (short-subunit alcohol dehydrogenase family)